MHRQPVLLFVRRRGGKQRRHPVRRAQVLRPAIVIHEHGTVHVVLDLARDAAHNVERPAAPITTFLLGYAAAAADGNPAETERLAGLATALAARWDKPADAPDVVDEVEVEIEELDEVPE